MKILYVEDTPIDVALVRHTLASGAPDFVLEIAGTLAQAKTRLAGDLSPDVVLCDLHLPDGSGLELLAHIRANNLPLAVVIITATGDEEAVVASLRAGADAYLIKGREPMSRLQQVLTKAHKHFHAARNWRGRPIKVLYADGDMHELERARSHLAQHAPHIRLDVAQGGAAVLARLPTDASMAAEHDVLVLDQPLPDSDALDLIKTLRDERGLTLPIVLVSGHGSEEIAAHALHLGVDAYLIKQAGYLHELPSTLESVCHKATLERERTALMESEARIRLILDSTAEAIYGNDLEGRCTFVNPALLRILGYERAEDLLGRPIHGLIHHSHADGSPYPREECPIYGAYLHDQSVHRDDEVFWHRDGHAIPVEYWSYPMHRDGQVVGAVATFFDISERKRADEKLRQAAMVFEHTRDGVLITDLAGHILAVNRAFSQITGYAEEEVLGEHPSLLNSGRHEPAFFQNLWAQLHQNGHWQGEIWNRRKNGEVFPQWVTLSRVHDGQGAPSHFVGVYTDLSLLKRTEEQLDHLAHHDALTDLPNRTLMQSRLRHALDRAKRHGLRAGVLHIDLDHFKAVNDSLGHEVGDQLLLTVVGRLKTRIREEDTLARLGGDEFLLLLEPIAEAQEAAEVARDLLAMLALPFACQGDREVFLGASIGISIYPDDAASVTELLRDAETAMYQAKEQGRGQFCFYTGDMNINALAKLELETALRRALERNELVLHYQPKVDLLTGHISGAEALLRWQRGTDLIPPASFIPLAEKSGLIVSIGAWVIESACHQIRAWREAGLPEVKVAVNVSARQFRSEGLKETVASCLSKYQIPPQLLELELTESMLMEDPKAAAHLLDQLKQIGVKLSLDDFGTGYSSFAYLSRFPIDTLKIDQSFVARIVTEPDAASIVSAVIGLARRLRLQVVAEGVETEAQLGYLRKQGCEMMQGYYFSRPVPEHEFAEMLRMDKSLPVAEVTTDRTLLLVDDEAHVLSSLRRMLRGEGYRILTATGAREGLELLATNHVQVILSDQRMPDMNGTDFLGRVRELYPDTVRIVLSGYSELDTIIQAVNQGAIYKFLLKPWNDDQLREHLRDAFRYYEAVLKPITQASPGT